MSRPVVPNHVSNDIAKAVQAAIHAGVSVRDFIHEARECWELELRDELDYADKEFSRALKLEVR